MDQAPDFVADAHSCMVALESGLESLTVGMVADKGEALDLLRLSAAVVQNETVLLHDN